MASYVMEVLSSMKQMELHEVNTKSPEVASAVESCKSEVLSFLENVYVRFTERPRQNKALANKVNQLQEDVKELVNTIQQVTRNELSKCDNELEKNLDLLTRANTALNFVETLYKIHELLFQINTLREGRSYVACMQKVKETEDFCTSLNRDEKLPVVDELKIELCREKSLLLITLSNTFKEQVIVQPGENYSVMKIRNENVTMEEVLSALYYYQTSAAPLDRVTRFLWNNVFVPVVDCTTEIKTSSENEFSILEVTTVDANKRSSYLEVFVNIKTILNFLLANFDISLGEDLTTLGYIGRDIRDNLSELLIKHCLQHTIPSNDEGLQRYKEVIAATEDLEKSLLLSKIFTEDTTSILEYANNIDVLFINKKCRDYVTTAQNLMKKDLHDLVEVGHQYENGTDLEITIDFPKCSVSKSVVDLLNLLEKILTEAINSSEVRAGRLFCTVKTICLTYGIFVPEHHKKLLQTIPQQIAVFHNNCMYISQKLFDWNDTYLKKLPSLLNVGSHSFFDEGRQLRQIASEKFTSFVASQIKQIEETMKEAGLQKPTLEEVEAATEKCLRQCLRQQELLKTVWQKVLPYAIYNKTLGAILNSLCTCLINATLRFEDISCEAAKQLGELFKMVQTRGPKLFTDPKEVSLFVESWYKINEVAFVLGASLLEINDRWADGKGPLGLQFKALELKQLIRALFQNTERRAALLEKIHD